MTELGTSKIDGDKAEYVTDGRQFNEWKVLREKVIPGNAAFKIDLESLNSLSVIGRIVWLKISVVILMF